MPDEGVVEGAASAKIDAMRELMDELQLKPLAISHSEAIGIVEQWQDAAGIHYGRDLAEYIGGEGDETAWKFTQLIVTVLNALPALVADREALLERIKRIETERAETQRDLWQERELLLERIKELEAEREADFQESVGAQVAAETYDLNARVGVSEGALWDAETTLNQITDPSYIGNYDDAATVSIYRKWARSALDAVRAVLAGGEDAAEECHICHRPRDQAGEWYCSAAHPLGGEAGKEKRADDLA